jgi:hypothetical protein
MRSTTTVEITVRTEEYAVTRRRNLAPRPLHPPGGIDLLVPCPACGAPEGEECRKYSPLRRSEGMAEFRHWWRVRAGHALIQGIRRHLFGETREWI